MSEAAGDGFVEYLNAERRGFIGPGAQAEPPSEPNPLIEDDGPRPQCGYHRIPRDGSPKQVCERLVGHPGEHRWITMCACTGIPHDGWCDAQEASRLYRLQKESRSTPREKVDFRAAVEEIAKPLVAALESELKRVYDIHSYSDTPWCSDCVEHVPKKGYHRHHCRVPVIYRALTKYRASLEF